MGERPRQLTVIVVLCAFAPILGACSLLFQAPRDGQPPPIETAGPSVAATPSEATQVPGSPGAPPSAEQLAALLSPDDFAAVGVPGAGIPTVNSSGPGEAYVVYQGLSAGAGGIEMDVFVLPSAGDAAALVPDPGLYALDEAAKRGIGAERATFIGESSTNDGTSTYDAIRAQKGRVVVDIGIPTTETSRDQLIALARLVIERSQPYQ
jgi:hypothetical protein